MEKTGHLGLADLLEIFLQLRPKHEKLSRRTSFDSKRICGIPEKPCDQRFSKACVTCCTTSPKEKSRELFYLLRKRHTRPRDGRQMCAHAQRGYCRAYFCCSGD